MGEISSEKRLYVDWGKLATLFMINVTTAVLAVLEVIDGGVATGVIMATLGYVVGNGRQAARGLSPQPVLGARPKVQVDEEGVLRVTDLDDV